MPRLDHHQERLPEQEIAHQHARLVAPDDPRRRPPAPQIAFVDHIVVEQRRVVQELDRRREVGLRAVAAPNTMAAATVSIGRSRLPPASIR